MSTSDTPRQGLSIVSSLRDREYHPVVRRVEENFEGYLALVLLAGYSSIILYNIAARYFFGSQFSGGLSLILGAVVWLTWVTSAWAVRQNSHLRFSLFRQTVSQRFSYVIYWIEWIIWLGFIGAIFWTSIAELRALADSGAKVVGLSIVPRWSLYLGVVVGMVLHLVRVLQQMALITDMYLRGEDITPETKIGE
jgi:TRAP-type C4-dicarboxylate transport system permease small subunit